MTILERVKSIVSNGVDIEKDSLEKLVYMAYFIGLEQGAREELEKHNKISAEQKKRAEECRYHKMARKVIGDIFIYSGDYSQEMTGLFGSDETEF